VAKRQAAIPDFNLLLVAVPDRAVSDVARTWESRVPWKGRTVLHTSGALGSHFLAPLHQRGAAVGSLHPLRSMPWPQADPEAFRGIYFGIQGEAAAVRLARRLARDAGGRALEVREGGKALYHLAACLSSGYLLALIDAAATRIAAGSTPGARFRDALLGLAESTVRNARKAGLATSLTGPIPRGDIIAVRAHLASLRRLPPEWSILHAILARHTLNLALRSRRLSPAAARRLRQLLSEPNSSA
jgi:predicted short-subunit dehydrogenase-like oxidoreductase (DUF2520 family)